MYQMKLRRTSSSIIVLLLVLLVLFFGVCAVILYSLYLDDLVLFYWFTVIYTLLFFAPIISVVIVGLYRYCTRIVITEEGTSVIYPTGRKVYMPREEISVMGRIAFTGLDSKIFFCTASQHEIMDFFQTHQTHCKQLFGEKRMEELKKTEDGRWKMAVAVYARFSRDKYIFYLYHHAESVLEEIAHLLKKEVMITGPMLIA